MDFGHRHFRQACAVTAAGLAFSAAGPATAALAAAPGTPGPAVQDRLYGVSAVSASDVWAVGLTPDSGLIMHWDGTAWSTNATPQGYLEGVAATSASNAWAVGGSNWFTPNATLVYHWDGKSWNVLPSATRAVLTRHPVLSTIPL